jgi:hypothetical protein
MKTLLRLPTTLAVATLLALLAGCNSAPTHMARGGFTLPLPSGFDDRSAEMLAQLKDDAPLAERARQAGWRVEPHLSFETGTQMRSTGGCSVMQSWLSAPNPDAGSPLPAVAQQLGQNLAAAQQQSAMPWLRMRQGYSVAFNPWGTIQDARPVASGPITLAGLPGWQQTWRLAWTPQPGPVQPVGLVRIMLADAPQAPNLAKGSRRLLQAVCGITDIEGYADTALAEVVSALDGLGWAEPKVP